MTGAAREEARPENTAPEHDGKNGDQPLDIRSYTCILVCYETAGLSDTAGQANRGAPAETPCVCCTPCIALWSWRLPGRMPRWGIARGRRSPARGPGARRGTRKVMAALHPMHCVKGAAVPVRLASLGTHWPAQNRPRIVDQSGSEVCQFSSVTHGTFLGRRPLVPPAQGVALVVLHKSRETPAGLPGR